MTTIAPLERGDVVARGRCAFVVFAPADGVLIPLEQRYEPRRRHDVTVSAIGDMASIGMAAHDLVVRPSLLQVEHGKSDYRRLGHLPADLLADVELAVAREIESRRHEQRR